MPNRLFHWGSFLPPLPMGGKFIDIEIGYGWAFLIDCNCMAWSVGLNSGSQLGDGSSTNRLDWVRVCCNYCFCKIKSGSTNFAVAQDVNGYLYSWGSGWDGQLANGSYISNYPRPVLCCYQYRDYAVGEKHVIAIRCDGVTVVWGKNDCGALGSPMGSVDYPSTNICCNYCYCCVSAGAMHSLAIRTDGLAFSWGRNDWGQLGDNTRVAKCQPVAVCCDYCYTKIVASGAVSYGIRTGGLGVAFGSPWGKGDGTSTESLVPRNICCDYCYMDISGDYSEGFGIRTDGRLFSWGCGCFGSLGSGVCATCFLQPVEVCGNCTYCKLCSRIYSTIAWSADNKLFSWGENLNGRLGLGDTTNRCVPTCNTTWS